MDSETVALATVAVGAEAGVDSETVALATVVEAAVAAVDLETVAKAMVVEAAVMDLVVAFRSPLKLCLLARAEVVVAEAAAVAKVHTRPRWKGTPMRTNSTCWARKRRHNQTRHLVRYSCWNP